MEGELGSASEERGACWDHRHPESPHRCWGAGCVSGPEELVGQGESFSQTSTRHQKQAQRPDRSRRSSVGVAPRELATSTEWDGWGRHFRSQKVTYPWINPKPKPQSNKAGPNG